MQIRFEPNRKVQNVQKLKKKLYLKYKVMASTFKLGSSKKREFQCPHFFLSFRHGDQTKYASSHKETFIVQILQEIQPWNLALPRTPKTSQIED